ncbi:uncharacterized protein KD926_010093 [Aspergillus affinis]|uniref:uncharacterized protein n=1 Tax=Aspergillus affinis TaxID=1070780 RepID=UPI0022FE52E1|nr:uncharacterized protein KD926_010093 [Aspergillus affinis]KAI9038991.1 hypothetical protein KD926_010093 [Aspergillus affinis]
MRASIPTCRTSHDWGLNTAIYPITPDIVQMAMARHPDHIRMVIVCMTLSHLLNRIRKESASQARMRDFFHYRGRLIRSLSDDIQSEQRRTSDRVIARMLTLLLEHANQPFAFGTYPAALFGKILNINYLRQQALDGVPGDLIQPAYEILNRIHGFSVARWAHSISTNPDWQLLGAIHQAAIAIYCILSVQSLGVLPWNAQLRDLCIDQANGLRRRLAVAVSSAT